MYKCGRDSSENRLFPENILKPSSSLVFFSLLAFKERKYSKIGNKAALSNTTTDLLKYRTKPVFFGCEEISYNLAKLLSKLLLSRNKILTIYLKVNKVEETMQKLI